LEEEGKGSTFLNFGIHFAVLKPALTDIKRYLWQQGDKKG
jgi:hypothetical protein